MLKFMYNKRHYIGAVLTVTVSLMLLVSMTASADIVQVPDPEHHHHCKQLVCELAPTVTNDGFSPPVGSGYVKKVYQNTTFYYMTSMSCKSTMYFFYEFDSEPEVPQTYQFTGQVMVPRYVDSFKISLCYTDSEGMPHIEPMYKINPRKDLTLTKVLPAHVLPNTLSDLNNWQDSNDGSSVYYYDLDIDVSKHVASGASMVGVEIDFTTIDNNRMLYFAASGLYLHHIHDYYQGSEESSLGQVFDAYSNAWDSYYSESGFSDFLRNLTKYSGLDFLTKIFLKANNALVFLITAGVDFIVLMLKPILVDVIAGPASTSIKSIFESIFSSTGIFIRTLEPALASLTNAITPELTKIADSVTNGFKNFSEQYLRPALNDYLDKTKLAHSDLAASIIESLQTLFTTLVVPSDTSDEVQEFMQLKDKLSNKLPFVTQLNLFFTVLFDPTNYSEDGGNGESLVFLKEFTALGIRNRYPKAFTLDSEGYVVGSIEGADYKRYILPYDFEVGKTYVIYATIKENAIDNVFSVLDNNGKSSYGDTAVGYRGTVTSLYVLGRTRFHISSIRVYEVVSADSGFSVDVMGTEVDIFNFDWYLPYKAYGDMVILSFVYLGFAWHLFKRLSSIV